MDTINANIRSAIGAMKANAITSFVTATILLSLLTMALTPERNGRFLYIQSNSILEGQNSIIAYERGPSGKLKPLTGSPFLTGGTGMNNNTHGKRRPNDNDTPIVLSAHGKSLFTVNVHSNSIAVFDIMPDGSLCHVKGSPFPSMGVGPVSLATRLMSHSRPWGLEQVQAGRIKPVLDKALPLRQARDVHRLIANNRFFGNLVLLPWAK